MKIIDPEYDIQDKVSSIDGPRIVVGREYREWWWKDSFTKNWIYHCQEFRIDKKTKELERRGNSVRYSPHMLRGKIE